MARDSFRTPLGLLDMLPYVMARAKYWHEQKTDTSKRLARESPTFPLFILILWSIRGGGKRLIGCERNILPFEDANLRLANVSLRDFNGLTITTGRKRQQGSHRGIQKIPRNCRRRKRKGYGPVL